MQPPSFLLLSSANTCHSNKVSHGADLNRRDNGGITVLFLALLESLCFDSNDYWAESAYTARLLIRCTSYLGMHRLLFTI